MSGPTAGSGVSPAVPGRGTVRAWAVVASVAIVAAAVVRVVSVTYAGWGLYSIRAAAAGQRLSDEELDAGDTVLLLGVATFVVLLLAGICFVVWLYLARTRVGAVPGSPPRWGPGWTIGAWFVPVANLVLPVLVVADLWRAATRRAPVLVVLWWVGALMAVVVDQLAGAARGARSSDPAYELDALFTVAVLHTVESVLDLAAAGLAVLIMARITGGITAGGPAAPGPCAPDPSTSGTVTAPRVADPPPVSRPVPDDPAPETPGSGTSEPAPTTRSTLVWGAVVLVVVAGLIGALVAVEGNDDPLTTIPVENVSRVVACGDRVLAYRDSEPGAALIDPRTDVVVSELPTEGIDGNVRCDAAGRRAYVPTGSELRVVDLVNGRTIGQVPTPVFTTDVAVTPDGHGWFTTDQATTTGTPPGLFAFGPDGGPSRLVAPLPAGQTSVIAAAPDGSHVYLVDTTSPAPLRSVDTRTGTVAEMPVPPEYENSPYAPDPAHDIALSPDSRTLYVAELGHVAVVDTMTGGLVRRLDPGGVPARIDLTPDGRSLVALSPVDGTLTVLDVADGTWISRTDVGGSDGDSARSPDDVAVSRVNDHGYVATARGVVVAGTTGVD